MSSNAPHLPVQSPSSARARWVGFAIAPVALAAILFSAWLLPRLTWASVRYSLLALFLLAFGWMLVSIFFPARVDRTCPRCGQGALGRLGAHSLRGLRCAACGFEDRQASAFLMAESEGSLEQVVLRERSLLRSGGLDPGHRSGAEAALDREWKERPAEPKP